MKRTGKQGMKRTVLGMLLALPLAAQAQSYSKTETIEYHDDTALWVLGQVKRTTTDGVETSSTSYGWKALPTQTTQFGKVTQTVTYDSTSAVGTGQLGTLKTVKDGNNNTTTFGSWKRGIPQSITYADGNSQSASVDDRGWITWVEDERDSRTCYTYDAMGRLASATYTSESAANTCDASKWTVTNYTWEYRNVAEHGLPAGHWLRRDHTGNHRRNTFYDVLWRPVLEHYYDGADTTASIQARAWAYDADGRVTFASYPVNALVAGTTGTWTEYDALGRVTSVSQNSELGLLTTLTEYQTGFKTKVTSPKGQVTTTSYQTYDQPSYDWPVAITHPEGTYTDITRDVYGKVLMLTRRNGNNTAWQRRYYVYNAAQELCKSTETETGTTAYGYDGAGNLSWSAAGLSWSPPAPCEHTKEGVVARRVDRTYDARNRLKTLSFPDGKGNQSWTYTPTGQPAQVIAYNSAGADTARTDYLYHRRGLLTRETLITDAVNWPYDYTYNGHGHLASNVWHGITVDYAPNGLGQPTKAGTYASGVQYYPNGAVKQFTYGNGIVHTMTQNARQLPARSIDSYGMLDLGYAYDKHANVASITDATAGARQSRTMAYDGLDRLTQATGPSFGTATYTYDPLDNLKTAHLTGGPQPRNYVYLYDNAQRLISITNGAGGPTVVGLQYGLQGNLSNKNGQAYVFDFGNRLREATGKGTYLYDGHGRRVRDVVNGVPKHSQYLMNGQLAFTADSRAMEVREYIYLGDDLVAIRERDATTNLYTTRYQHSDGLGSALVETDANRAVLTRTEYEPYGLSNRPTLDGPGFTGHVQDAATGLTYMQQRYYDPAIGRFLSVDPDSVDTYSVHNFGRYFYAQNDPYGNTDPDGRAACPNGECPSVTVVGVRPVSFPINFNIASDFEVKAPLVQVQRESVPPNTSTLDKLKDCASDQFGISDLAALAAIGAGRPIPGTKPFVTPGSSKGTSLAGMAADKMFGKARLPFRAPTIVGGPGTGRALAIAGTKSVARFAGRAVPVLGWAMLAYDIGSIAFCTLSED